MRDSRPRRALTGFAALLCLGVVIGSVLIDAGARAEAGGELIAQPVLGTPAGTFLGASPGEAPGEVWALTRDGGSIARYTDADGWETLPAPQASGGGALEGLSYVVDPAAGRATPAGGVAAAAEASAGQLIVVRDPGGPLRAAPDPGSLLEPEGEAAEELFGSAGTLLAAVEEPGGTTGAFVVPAVQGSAKRVAVLGFDGTGWTREKICTSALPAPGCAAPPAALRVLGVDASSPGNAWLLARGAVSAQGVELFRREPSGGEGGTPVWRQQSLEAGQLGKLFAKATASVPQPPASPLSVGVAPRTVGQPLVVTPQGVWADAVLTVGSGAAAEKFDATIYYDIGAGAVTGSWCDLAGAICASPLGAELPVAAGRSFAWPPSASSGVFGTRAITGVGQGAMLSLEGSTFVRIPLGGDAGASGGAAFSAPDEGWLGAEPPIHLSRANAAQTGSLAPWPVPFRRPLTAIVAQPGAPVGALGSEALAVGDNGQVARYQPGLGWEAEPLLSGSGKRATPRLRGVAWPEPGRAFAVGDEGAMWIWQKATGLWSPDPGAPPNLIRGDFTGIAFDPGNPNRGYAVGKQGLLLRYGRQWTPEALPAGVNPEANITSIAFAGDEALAAFKFPTANERYSGGLLVNDGSGWRVEPAVAAALGKFHEAPEQVAGLPDGGAVVVSEDGEVLERQGPNAGWAQVPGDPIGFPVAAAAIREGGQVRAIVSVEEPTEQAGSRITDAKIDSDQLLKQPGPGQPPLLLDPYPLPESGSVLRQTIGGWHDEQREVSPAPRPSQSGLYDWPIRPDPVLALLINPNGGQGWAVGGVTGTGLAAAFIAAAVQTGGVMRYGPAAKPPSNASPDPVEAEPGKATFAIGGDAQCANQCADFVGNGIGPERWLEAAVGTAAQIEAPRLHAFLYTGRGVAQSTGGPSPKRLGTALSRLAFSREEDAYAERIGADSGTLPAFAAPAESDLDKANSLSTFRAAFSGFGAPLGSAPPGAGVAPVSPAGTSQGYYSFDSGGAGGAVRVVVLDYSAATLGGPQRCWLAQQLAAAKVAETPAIVIGERDLAGLAPNGAEDAGQVVPILVGASAPAGCELGAPAPGAASAYFFDFPEENRAYRLAAAGRSLPAYGSGTLGYVAPVNPLLNTQFLGASGFLLASVETSARKAATNVAPVSVKLIPNIGELAIDATDGTILRRSQPALFQALARRHRAGMRCEHLFSGCARLSPDPYVPIPSRCQGAKCATGILPEYTFTSSRPDIADFVSPDPASTNPRHLLLVHEKPVLDPHSGLLCAFNAGTTTVTVSTGGLSYSQKVTVLGGTAQRPCGTTPLRKEAEPEPELPLAPETTPETQFTSGSNSVPPPPVPAPVSQPVPHHPHAPQPVPAATPFFAPAPVLTPLTPIVPPVPPPNVQTTPPSGTSPVTQPAVSPEPEEEEEAAFDLVHHMSALRSRPRAPAALAAYPAGGSRSSAPYYVPALAMLAALGLAVGLRGARRPRKPRLAYETNTTSRRSR